MSDRLPRKFTVQFHDDETTWSFISRVAFLNERTPREFCNDIGASLQSIASGDDHAIERIAYVTGACSTAIRAQTFLLQGRNRYLFKDELIGVQGLDFKGLKFCPCCIQDDIETGTGPLGTRPYRRANWVFGSFRSCPTHGVELVSSDAEAGNSALDFAVAIQPHLERLSELVSQAVPGQDPVLESYVQRRLNGQFEDVHWLDGMRLDTASRVCEIIGGNELDRDMPLADMTDGMLRDATRIGYNATCKGEAGIQASLAVIQSRAPKPSTTSRQAWPALHRYLTKGTSDPDFNALTRVIVEQCVATMPIGPGETCLGHVVRSRKVHSVRSAAVERKVHPHRLRRLLEKGGVIPADSNLDNDLLLFDSSAAEPFLEKAASSLSLEAAARYLHLPPQEARHFFNAEFIEPLVPTADGRLTQHTFPVAHLDEFLASITRHATVLKPSEKSYLSIIDAGRQAGWRSTEIVRLLVDGKLSKVRTDHQKNALESIYVEPDEVLGLIDAMTGMSLRQAEDLLKTSSKVVRALVDEGYLQTLWRDRPMHGNRHIGLVPESVEQFAARYITLANLAKETEIHHVQLRRELDNKGVVPALDKEVVHSTFYDRLALPKFS